MTFTAQQRLTIVLHALAAVVLAFIIGFALATPAESHNRKTGVVTEEDGSGVQYINGKRVRVFPEDTFVWDCRLMGNKRCGR